MISEKTVELNLTTELVNWNFYMTGVRPYILAPSQRQEGVLGYDASVGLPNGYPTLIQYKRAYFKVRTNELMFHLNRNTNRDQHLRLFILEMLGNDVWYALPLFYETKEVITHRRKLLKKTLFVKPSWIVPVGGLTGHHEIKYNLNTQAMTVHSEEGKNVERYLDFYDFAREFDYVEPTKKENESSLEKFVSDFNNVVVNKDVFKYEEYYLKPITEDESELMNSMSAIVR